MFERENEMSKTRNLLDDENLGWMDKMSSKWPTIGFFLCSNQQYSLSFLIILETCCFALWPWLEYSGVDEVAGK